MRDPKSWFGHLHLHVHVHVHARCGSAYTCVREPSGDGPSCWGGGMNASTRVLCVDIDIEVSSEMEGKGGGVIAWLGRVGNEMKYADALWAGGR